MNDLETRLQATLQSVAVNTNIEDRLPEVLARTPGNRHPQHRILVAAAAFVVVAGGLGSALLLASAVNPTTSETESPPNLATVQPPASLAATSTMTPSGDPWPLPLLSLDTAQIDMEVSLVSAVTEFTTPDPAVAGRYGFYLQVLRRDADRFEPPMIWIETDERGSDYARSGKAQEESIFAGEHTINGVEFALLEDGDRTVLVAEMPSGASVTITGLGVTSDELVDFANQLVEKAPEPGWDVVEPPLGMEVVFEGHITGIYDPPGWVNQRASWQLAPSDSVSPVDNPAGQVGLFVESRGETSFEKRLYEIAGSSTDQTLVWTDTVRGHPGAIVEAGDVRVALWRETDEASVFIDIRPSELPLDIILTALIEVDEATWQVLERDAMDEDSRSTSTTVTVPPTTPDNEPQG